MDLNQVEKKLKEEFPHKDESTIRIMVCLSVAALANENGDSKTEEHFLNKAQFIADKAKK